MNEIICPHCKKAFKVDEAGFAEILKQVRDHEFEKELREREEMLKTMQAQFEMQMQMQQQMPQQPPEMSAGAPPQAPAQGGFQNTQGSNAFVPRMGGTPPAQAFPEGTREQVTGKTKSGEDIA